MTKFLSPAWVDALDAKLRAGPPTPGDPVVVQYLVAGPDGDHAYHIELGSQGNRAHSGHAADADVTFTMDTDTARLISDGTLSTEEAFITGRLQLSGDPTLLIDAYRAETGA